MATLKYKDPVLGWQTLAIDGGVTDVQIIPAAYGESPSARITAGVLYITWPADLQLDSTLSSATAAAPADKVGELKSDLTATKAMLAPAYSTSATYAVGDHVTYNGGYYVCKVAIATAEAWTAAHWTQVTVGGENADLRSALSQISGNPEITFTEGGCYNTQNNTVDLDNGLIQSANYDYAVVSCSPGDMFTITGAAGNAQRLYAFVDSSSPANVLMRSEGNENVTEKLIAAPTGASKLIVNAKKANSHPCYYGRIVKKSISEIKALTGMIVDSTGGTAYIANKIIGTDGTETANSSYLVTDYIKVSERSAVVFNGALGGVGTGYNNIHAYDKNKNWISGIYRQTSSSQNVIITLTLPAGCEYIKIMTSASGNYKNFILYYDLNNTIEKINQAFIGDSEKIQEIKEKDYTSLALFEDIAVCGDSWGCGWVAVDRVRHDGISWIKIMARKNGVNGFVYAEAGYNTKTWLSGNQGLSKLLADTAKNLYFIVLGINPEPEDTDPPTGANLGSIADCNVDYTQNADTFFGRYGRIIGNIQTHAPNAKIVCIIPVLRYNSTAQAIPQIAEFYGVPWFDAKNSAYFSTDFYKNNRQSAHPLGITYAGIANAFEELLIKKIVSSPTYWKDYVGNN